MSATQSRSGVTPQRCTESTAAARRAAPWLVAWLALPLALACATRPHAAPDDEALRADGAMAGEADDPALRARRAGVEAARAREGSTHVLEELELRVGDEYVDEHQVRVLARLPIRHPGEVRAEREIFAAETEMAEHRLEAAALTRRAEVCFPAVEAEVQLAERSIYDDYARRQEELLKYSQEGQRNGLINEVDASRFELASRLRLATREPSSVLPSPVELAALPSLQAPEGQLVRSEAALRDAVRRHHPSVALRQAAAERYEALAARERSRARPWIKFVDFNYERLTGEENPGQPPDPARNGGGGRVAFTIPFGGSEKANSRRYSALVREQRSEADAVVEEQMLRGMRALQTLQDFERRIAGLQELLVLADGAEAVADKWWQSKLAGPSAVAALLDEAFDARRAVLGAREEAGVARCTLLAMTGVPAEEWPRGLPTARAAIAPSKPSPEADDSSPDVVH